MAADNGGHWLGLQRGLRVSQPESADPEAPPIAPPPAPPAAPRPAPVDPIAALITTSQQHYDAGERELKAGHLDKARKSSTGPWTCLLESPYGARTDARLREHFDRLVDRINA